MDNIKVLKNILISMFLFSIAACAHGSGDYRNLGNNGKKFTSAGDMSSEDWNHPQELERVWQHSLLRIPSESGEYVSLLVGEMEKVRFSGQKKYPTVIYLHGCSGIWSGTIHRINTLAKNGFAVVAPPSFARDKYPQSCDISKHQGGLYRDTIKMRQYDAGNTIAKAKQLPWVDENNVFLMGLSEGGITTATFYSKNKSHSVNARVIEGWTCTSIWDEYRGVRAPKAEPVLSLLGSKDPWLSLIHI